MASRNDTQAIRIEYVIKLINQILVNAGLMDNYEWFDKNHFLREFDKLIFDLCLKHELNEGVVRRISGWVKGERPSIK